MKLRVSAQPELGNSPRGEVPLLGSLVDAANKNVGAEGGDNGHNEEPHASAVLVHLGDLLLLLLALEETRVGAELEDKVRNVGAEEHEGGTTREDKQVAGRHRLSGGDALQPSSEVVTISLRGVVLTSASSSYTCARQLTGGRDNEGDAREGKKRRASLRGSDLKRRLVEVEAGADVSQSSGHVLTRRNSSRAQEGGWRGRSRVGKS